MLTSPRRGISYPNPDRSDRPDIPAHILNLVNALEIDAISVQGTDAQRTGRVHMTGVFFWTTDTLKLWYDDGTTWQPIGASNTGTSFPGTPLDGDKFVYAADPTNNVYWNFQYIATGTKWVFIGGNPMFSEVTAAEATSAGTYAALTTAGPSITLPFAGDFAVQIGCQILVGTGNPDISRMSYDIGATTAVDGDACLIRMPSTTGNGEVSITRRRNKVGLSAVTLTAKYKSPGGTYANRWMAVWPIKK